MYYGTQKNHWSCLSNENWIEENRRAIKIKQQSKTSLSIEWSYLIIQATILIWLEHFIAISYTHTQTHTTLIFSLLSTLPALTIKMFLNSLTNELVTHTRPTRASNRSHKNISIHQSVSQLINHLFILSIHLLFSSFCKP